MGYDKYNEIIRGFTRLNIKYCPFTQNITKIKLGDNGIWSIERRLILVVNSLFPFQENATERTDDIMANCMFPNVPIINILHHDKVHVIWNRNDNDVCWPYFATLAFLDLLHRQFPDWNPVITVHTTSSILPLHTNNDIVYYTETFCKSWAKRISCYSESCLCMALHCTTSEQTIITWDHYFLDDALLITCPEKHIRYTLHSYDFTKSYVKFVRNGSLIEVEI